MCESHIIPGPGHGSEQKRIPGLEDLEFQQTNKYTLGSGESHKEKVKRVVGDGWEGLLSTMTFEQTLEDRVCPEDICGRRSIPGSCWAVRVGGVLGGESKYVSEQDREGVRVQIIEGLLAAVRTLDFTSGGYEITVGSVQSRGMT